MAEDTNKGKTEEKPAAKAKAGAKAKPPKVEDKPFSEFIEEHFIPALKEAFASEGIDNIDLTFIQQTLPIAGVTQKEPCWQVIGKWQNGQRQFNLYFPDAVN